MSYSLRNSLILGGLLILVIIGFIIGNSSSVKKLNAIQSSYENNQKLLNELKAAHPDIKDQDLFLQSLKELEDQVQKESKIITRENDPTLTYKYLLDICDNFCPEVKFDFRFNLTGRVETTAYNTYTLNGNASIQALYTFLYQIESQFLLYIIDSIKLLEETEGGVSTGKINFTIVLNAYYEEDAPEFKDIPFRKLKYRNVAYNPFYSRIHAPTPDEEEQGFIDTYSVVMIGLTPDKIFLRDAVARIHVLSPGDKVAYGYLESINWDEQYAVFKLNEIGIIKEKIIYLYNKE